MEIMGNAYLDDAILSSRLLEVSESVRSLAGEAGRPASVREQAQAVRDLLELMALWPVPSSLRLEEDISIRLSGLCRSSGIALCRTRPCAVSREGDSAARCPVVLS